MDTCPFSSKKWTQVPKCDLLLMLLQLKYFKTIKEQTPFYQQKEITFSRQLKFLELSKLL